MRLTPLELHTISNEGLEPVSSRLPLAEAVASATKTELDLRN
jgi:hypothetical protein